MNDYNGREEKKGGFLSALSGLFRGGSPIAGGASSGMGSAGSGLAGLFATKAGVVGMVLGGATIAAGVGVVYNFIGDSSRQVYSPELFQNSYYEEESSRAGLERTNSRDTSAAASSTLDIFREQAKKDGFGLGGEAAEGGNADASAGAPMAAADSSAAGAVRGDVGGGGGPKLPASTGFGSKGGGGGAGSGTSIPRLQPGGGLSGGIGAQFQPVYRPPAQAGGGKISGMSASAARVKSSPRYTVPNTNKKGAYGQARYAGKMGSKAAYSADKAGSRTDATTAFSGETTGSGDAGAIGSGAGLGGAGVSSGAELKGNDPSLNSNESTAPDAPDPEDVDPWQKYEDMAMYALLAGGALLIITKVLAKYPTMRMWAMVTGYATIAAALVVIYAGFMMFNKYEQKMMGGVYIAAGLLLIWKAYEAMSGLEKPAPKVPLVGVPT